MKRYSLIQARGGDFTPCMEGAEVEGEGNDAVELAVKGGTVTVIVPADLPDGEVCEECWFNEHTCIDIELENGIRITGWVQAGEVHLEAEFPSRVKVS